MSQERPITVNPEARSSEEPLAVHPAYGLGGQPPLIPHKDGGVMAQTPYHY